MFEPSSLQSKHIVVVEDDETVRHSLSLVLRTRGIRVETYRSGAELLSARTLPNPNCFLIDFKMANLDGISLLAKLRDLGLNQPALLITGFVSNTLNQRALEVGYCSIIEKPIHSPDLFRNLSIAMSE